ncbi:MAG: hypothetical protein J6X94_05205 [Lachnospiraceae bacterium]|nr:hypothetical protein [Lachnospiraceae bacterium]
MGRGSYTAADWNKLRNSRNIASAQSETEIFKSTSCDQRFDPKFIQTREARDSEDHPESLPIILGLDVTGSMGYLAKMVAQESLNETMMKLYSTNAVKDPALMFAAYGDVDDRSPLQVTQFESDIRIAEQLLDLWLENAGSGRVVPNLLWYFAAKHTSLDSYEKRKKKGYIFTIGDHADCRKEGEPGNLPELYERVFGEKVNMKVGDIVKAAEEKFEIFHLFLDNGFAKAKNIVSFLPGHTMVIRTDEIDCIPEIVISTIQMTEGMEFEETLKQWPEEKLPVVKRALSELTIKSKKKGLFF